MNLYLLKAKEGFGGYDTFDSVVVAAESEDEARRIHPSSYMYEWDGKEEGEYSSWCAAEDVRVVLIGKAVKGTAKGVVCASFNAG